MRGRPELDSLLPPFTAGTTLAQPPRSPRVRRWLRPGGAFLAIVGRGHWTALESYLVAPMFWDHADTAAYLERLRDVGLAPVWDRFIPEGSSGWMV